MYCIREILTLEKQKLVIKNVNSDSFDIIRSIAYKSWPVAYGKILSDAQLQWMLANFYSDKSLQQNIDDNHLFYILENDNVALGFFAVEHHYKNEATSRLHKLYLNPETQTKGFGKKILGFIEAQCLQNSAKTLSLNVNKFNKAVGFYEKMGFEIVRSEVIEIGNGFFMDDFQMEKQI